MYPIPSLKNEFVSVTFSSHEITCSWIQKTVSGTAELVLRAYKRYPLNNLQINNLTPYNPTQIKKYITSFLQHYELENAFILISLDGPGLIEQFVPMPLSTAHRTDFDIPHTTSMQWEYRYLYPHDGQFVFYVYALPRSLILQYTLLAISMHSNMVMMTTKTAALLCAYKNIFGTAFRKSQLALDMIRYDNNAEDLISFDALRRGMIIDGNIDVKTEKSFIATAYGLFCGQKE